MIPLNKGQIHPTSFHALIDTSIRPALLFRHFTQFATAGILVLASCSMHAVTTESTTIQQNAVPSIKAARGGAFQITYNWSAKPMPANYSAFVDFVDSKGKVVAQDDYVPAETSKWSGNFSYTHTVKLPATMTQGVYKVMTGLYSPTGTVPLTAGKAVTQATTNVFETGTVAVLPTCSITSFGAVGDGKTNNTTAIQKTFNYAAANKCIALIPAGTFAYSGTITANGIAVEGVGATSILKPLTVDNEALILKGNGGSVSKLVMQSSAKTRLSTGWSGMIWVENASNFYVENVLINGSSCTGIMSYNSHSGSIHNNTVENTLADSITQVLGSYDITVSANRIINSGDDGISDNSYAGETPVNNITIQQNNVLNNRWGRGVEVSGGSNITFSDNYIDNTDGYSDVYIACENEWGTEGVNGVLVTGNTLILGGPNQGSTIIYNSQSGKYTVSNITVTNNTFYNPRLAGVQYAGNGPETKIAVDNNVDYSDYAFSFSSNSLASVSQANNKVLNPGGIKVPAPPVGRGCTFTGC